MTNELDAIEALANAQSEMMSRDDPSDAEWNEAWEDQLDNGPERYKALVTEVRRLSKIEALVRELPGCGCPCLDREKRCGSPCCDLAMALR